MAILQLHEHKRCPSVVVRRTPAWCSETRDWHIHCHSPRPCRGFIWCERREN